MSRAFAQQSRAYGECVANSPLADHDAESLLRSLIENVPGAIYRCALDRDWTMELIGDEIERISGYPTSDFIRNACRTFASITHPDDRANVERDVAAAVTAGRTFALEYRVVRADGGVRWVLERGAKAVDSTGREWLDGVIFDITERRRAERQLREAEAEAARVEELEAARGGASAARRRGARRGARQRTVRAAARSPRGVRRGPGRTARAGPGHTPGGAERPRPGTGAGGGDGLLRGGRGVDQRRALRRGLTRRG
jgi:PAS domain S-box-containing protein